MPGGSGARSASYSPQRRRERRNSRSSRRAHALAPVRASTSHGQSISSGRKRSPAQSQSPGLADSDDEGEDEDDERFLETKVGRSGWRKQLLEVGGGSSDSGGVSGRNQSESDDDRGDLELAAAAEQAICLEAALLSCAAIEERVRSSSPHKMARGKHRRSVSCDVRASSESEFKFPGGALSRNPFAMLGVDEFATVANSPWLGGDSNEPHQHKARSQSLSPKKSRKGSTGSTPIKLPDAPGTQTTARSPGLSRRNRQQNHQKAPPTAKKKPFSEMMQTAKAPKLGRHHKRGGRGHRRHRSDSGMDYSGYRGVEDLLNLPTFAEHDRHDPLGVKRSSSGSRGILNDSFFITDDSVAEGANARSESGEGDSLVPLHTLPPRRQEAERHRRFAKAAAQRRQDHEAVIESALDQVEEQRRLTPTERYKEQEEITPRRKAVRDQRKRDEALAHLRKVSLFHWDKSNLDTETPMEKVVESLHLSRYGDSHITGHSSRNSNKQAVNGAPKNFFHLFRRDRHGGLGGVEGGMSAGHEHSQGSNSSSLALHRELASRRHNQTRHSNGSADPNFYDDGAIDFTDASLGVEKVHELCKHLRNCDFESLLFAGNRVTAEVVEDLAKCISHSCLDVDLSHNPGIGHGGTHVLVKRLLLSGRHQIMHLNLAGCNLGDDGAAHLALGLARRKVLRRLNVADNDITCIGAQELFEALQQDTMLEEINISWNHIGDAVIFAVERLKSLQDLSVAWNSLGMWAKAHAGGHRTLQLRHASEAEHADSGDRAGSHTVKSLAARLGAALAVNTTLMHLDIGANRFKTEDLCDLSLGLCANQTLVGLHMHNQPGGRVDSRGFIEVVDDEDVTDSTGHRHVQRHEDHALGIDDLGASETANHKHWIRRPHTLHFRGEPSDCWVCGGWREVTLRLTLHKSKVPQRLFEAVINRGLRVHLHADSYAGTQMNLERHKKPRTKKQKEKAEAAARMKAIADSLRSSHAHTPRKHWAAVQQSIDRGSDFDASGETKSTTDKSEDEADAEYAEFSVSRVVPPGKLLFYFSVVLCSPMSANQLREHHPGDTVGVTKQTVPPELRKHVVPPPTTMLKSRMQQLEESKLQNLQTHGRRERLRSPKPCPGGGGGGGSATHGAAAAHSTSSTTVNDADDSSGRQNGRKPQLKRYSTKQLRYKMVHDLAVAAGLSGSLPTLTSMEFPEQTKHQVAVAMAGQVEATQKLRAASWIVGSYVLQCKRREVSALAWLARQTMQFTIPEYTVQKTKTLMLGAENSKCRGTTVKHMNVISVEPRGVHERFFLKNAVPRCQDHRPPDLGRALVHRQQQLAAVRPVRNSSEAGNEDQQDDGRSEKKNGIRVTKNPGDTKAKIKPGRSSPTKPSIKQASKQASPTKRQKGKQRLKQQSSAERASQNHRTSRQLLKYGDGFDPLRGLFASRYHDSSPRDILHTPTFAARMVRSDWSFSKCALLLHRNELLSSSQRQAATVVSTVYKKFQENGLRLLRLFQFACATSPRPESDPMVIGQKDFISFCNACGFTQRRMFDVKEAEAHNQASTTVLSATDSQLNSATGSRRRVSLNSPETCRLQKQNGVIADALSCAKTQLTCFFVLGESPFPDTCASSLVGSVEGDLCGVGRICP
eukprot:INCI4044.1.p1 GENE.INCI4044.1~~INCI4044.1.p1  ORF type:complete len:1692 (+),score=245.93 INCI4044.1:198-5078(+)